MFKAVIFDWAGTTVDYGCFAPVQAFVEVFRHFGVEPTMEETRKPMGMLKVDHIRTMLGMERIAREWECANGSAPTEDDVRRLYARFEEKLLAILHDFATPKPGTLETVATLRQMGMKIGSTTGYTDRMMKIVAPAAAAQGYVPDALVTPDAVGGHGRPYPYMVFRNLEALEIASVADAVKVGDTVSDVKEGKAAGLFTVAVIEGSSEVGLTEDEFAALSPCERNAVCERAEHAFRSAGADSVIRDLTQLPALLQAVSN